MCMQRFTARLPPDRLSFIIHNKRGYFVGDRFSLNQKDLNITLSFPCKQAIKCPKPYRMSFVEDMGRTSFIRIPKVKNSTSTGSSKTSQTQLNVLTFYSAILKFTKYITKSALLAAQNTLRSSQIDSVSIWRKIISKN